MCDAISKLKNNSNLTQGLKQTNAPTGTILQMQRMLSHSTSAWDSPPSSEDELPPHPRDEYNRLALSLQTLEGMKALQNKLQVQEEEENRKKVKAPVQQHEYEVIFELGRKAGRAEQPPPKPCETCAERRRRNRIAAAEQRKRQREAEEEDN